MRQRDRALRTADDVAAGGALDVGGKTATIEQQDHLAVVLQRLVHGDVQLPADGSATAAILKLQPQIDRPHPRQRPVENPLRQRHQLIDPLLGTLPALQRRGRRTEHQWNLFQASPGPVPRRGRDSAAHCLA